MVIALNKLISVPTRDRSVARPTILPSNDYPPSVDPPLTTTGSDTKMNPQKPKKQNQTENLTQAKSKGSLAIKTSLERDLTARNIITKKLELCLERKES